MSKDDTLKNLVQEFINTTDYYKQRNLVNNIILRWSQSDNISTTSRNLI